MSDFNLDLDNLIEQGTNKLENGTANPEADNQGQQNWEQQYKELQSKFGVLGEENGKWRSFFNDTKPLLDKLAENDNALANAIIDGKITPELATAVIEGKVTLDMANLVKEASDQVRNDLGKDYADKTPKEVEKLIEERVSKISQNFDEKLTDLTKKQEFDNKFKYFIQNTPDLDDYIEDVDAYLDEHPEIKDIQVAYEAVKGRRLSKLSSEDKEKFMTEWSKELAMNAAGGSGRASMDPNKDSIESYLGL